jgi:RNA-binding protein NOB1
LVLDAGPLLAQLPLRGLAKKYYVPPSVMLELKDKHARDHLEFLKIAGMDLEVREAGPEALARVIEFAKQTGDYAVLSRPDLSVLALAYALEVERHGTWRIRSKLGGKTGQQEHEAQRLAQVKKLETKSTGQGDATAMPVVAEPTIEAVASSSGGEDGEELENDEDESGDAADEDEIAAAIAKLDLERAQHEPQDSSQQAGPGESSSTSDPAQQQASTSRRGSTSSSKTHDDDEEGWTTVPSSSRQRQEEVAADYGGSDGEGEWVTSDNILTQKHRDLGLVTDEAMTAMRGEPAPSHPGKRGGGGKKGKGKGKSRMTVATMTADYAVQNVLLQMGMALVSTEGLRIDKVRSWVLRCHACFKLCKDSEKKFCPSCGNPTLIRTSVTSAAPGSSSSATTNNGLQLHLKKNFQFRTRGTKTSLPLPKAGSTTSLKDPRNANLILREDQPEWQRALNQERIRKQKEQKALERQLEKGKDTLSARYEDPDWLPGLLSGGGGKEMGGLPDVGFGRRNNNQAKHGRRRK